MHRQGLNLSLENGHSSLVYNRSAVGDNCIAEDVIDQTVVVMIAAGSNVLHRRSVIYVCEH